MEILIIIFVGLGILALATFGLFVRNFMLVVGPDEALVLSGGQRRLPDGRQSAHRVVLGGRVLRIPIVESVQRLDLKGQPVQLKVVQAYSEGGVKLNVEGVAEIKIARDPELIENAIERFLGREREEIAQAARETIEAHLRGMAATWTAEQLRQDRIRFAEELMRASEPDLQKLGLQMDRLRIQQVAEVRL